MPLSLLLDVADLPKLSLEDERLPVKLQGSRRKPTYLGLQRSEGSFLTGRSTVAFFRTDAQGLVTSLTLPANNFRGIAVDSKNGNVYLSTNDRSHPVYVAKTSQVYFSTQARVIL